MSIPPPRVFTVVLMWTLTSLQLVSADTGVPFGASKYPTTIADVRDAYTRICSKVEKSESEDIPPFCQVPDVNPIGGRRHSGIGNLLRQPPDMALLIYQKIISPTKGRSCPMTPHCSAFAVQAISTKGPLTGIAQTVDRLNRCGHDASAYAKVIERGSIRFFDPVVKRPNIGVAR